MINSVLISNVNDVQMLKPLELELTNPYKTGIAITKIEGIGPVNATVHMSDYSAIDGSVFTNARVSNRNIVFSFRLVKNGIDSIEEVRHRVYANFPVKSPVKIVFKTDTRDVSIIGYVESCTPNIFSEKEDIQVSILCPDPNMYKWDEGDGWIYKYFSGTVSMFEFPFSNEVENIDDKNIVFSELINQTRGSIFYEGDNDIGIVFDMVMSSSVRGLILGDTSKNMSMILDDTKITELTGSGIVAGDVISINTMKGEKSISLTRIINGNPVVYNILSCLSKGTQWLYLSPSDNVFEYYAEEGMGNIQFTIKYKETFIGV